MSFRYYTNAISQASRHFAAGIFIVGLMLVGFAVIILALPELFAFLAAAIFFIAGVSCGVIAVKIFLTQRHMNKMNREDPFDCRKNVWPHIEEPFDL